MYSQQELLDLPNNEFEGLMYTGDKEYYRQLVMHFTAALMSSGHGSKSARESGINQARSVIIDLDVLS